MCQADRVRTPLMSIAGFNALMAWSRTAELKNELRPLTNEELERMHVIINVSRAEVSLPASTFKNCPAWRTGVQRPRGHHCHHISPDGGCANCHTHFCYACLHVYDRSRETMTICPNKCPTYCDETCDCADCPDCAQDRPCSNCDNDGKCWVCQPAKRPRARVWPCTSCKHINQPSSDACGDCHLERPSDGTRKRKAEARPAGEPPTRRPTTPSSTASALSTEEGPRAPTLRQAAQIVVGSIVRIISTVDTRGCAGAPLLGELVRVQAAGTQTIAVRTGAHTWSYGMRNVQLVLDGPSYVAGDSVRVVSTETVDGYVGAPRLGDTVVVETMPAASTDVYVMFGETRWHFRRDHLAAGLPPARREPPGTPDTGVRP